jgi:hypothetical protein
MSINDFLHKDNLATLWDVISDEDIFRFLAKPAQAEILQVFTNNIRGFFESERAKNSNLIEMNKKYILLILNYVKQSLKQKIPSKIKILDEAPPPSRELITYEELQTDRLSQFDKDLTRRQEEFTSAMKLSVPDVPKFTDNYEDKPITGIDKIIKEMTAKRNYDVEEINRSYTPDINQTTNWLKPQDTSIKTDKFVPQSAVSSVQNQPPRLKHINLDGTSVTNDKPSPKKNVTWGKEANDAVDELETSIFKKLKRVNNDDLGKSTNITIALEELPTTDDRHTIDDRLTHLETQMKMINDKLDRFLQRNA